jgi:hypothetical protein
VTALTAAGCGGDSSGDDRRDVARALQDQAKAFRGRDVKLFCTKTFLGSDLPPALARTFGRSRWRAGSQVAYPRDPIDGYGDPPPAQDDRRR